MNQIEAILKDFTGDYHFSGLRYLWFACEGYPPEAYSNIHPEYDPDTAFFKTLQILLESDEYCLYYNLDPINRGVEGKLLQETPIAQLEMYKKAWVGKQAMDEMDAENNYQGWWFLVYAPYSLAWKQCNEQGEFIKWWYAE